MKKILSTVLFSSLVVLLSLATAGANDTDKIWGTDGAGIWGTDGAAITKDGSGQPVAAPVVKPIVPIKKPVSEVSKDPRVVMPGTVAK